MGNNSTAVVVGANGSVWVAPVGTAAPTDATTTLNAAFKELGFISEDGATFTEGKEITDIAAWQSFYPIRKIVTGRTVEVSFSLREWNKRTIEFSLGGTVLPIGTGPYTYTPPSPETLGDKALVLNWLDGSKAYRLYVPRGIVSDNVEATLNRTSASDLPITFAAFDAGGGASIYTMFTNDPSFSS